MNSSLLAHSGKKEKPPQSYLSHVTGVVTGTKENWLNIVRFVPESRQAVMERPLIRAADVHDLGKLDEENQAVLSGTKKNLHLPIPHQDAGVKHLLEEGDENAATLVYAHHAPGLPNMKHEKLKATPFRFEKAIERTEKFLSEYLEKHKQEINGSLDIPPPPKERQKLSTVENRMLLSCIVDADYSDTSGQKHISEETRWEERAKKLDEYVENLPQKRLSKDDPLKERNQLRGQLYAHCKEVLPKTDIIYCGSPVGTGKTTAVMAHLLHVARKRNLRHIIVVLPYTNIIIQAVKVYREALVLEGENPIAIVAEHHHQADYGDGENGSDSDLRSLATTWTAPIIVTTAVQFFETIASNRPSKLRKLHQLPGSAVFIDESHAALPAQLMPPAWSWMEELSKNWGCYFCLCSGTPIRYWETSAFSEIASVDVKPLLSPELSESLEVFENKRTGDNFKNSIPPHFENAEALMNFILSKDGPRLVVMNTVKSAAALALRMRDAGKDVLHLSTALTPNDQGRVLDEIDKRLKGENSNQDWTLVATSCVECGLDFSFRNGFCELRSLQSSHQLSGRVGRNAEYKDACLYCFTVTDNTFSKNPLFNISISVFQKLIFNKLLSDRTIAEAVTLSFDMECRESGGLPTKICQDEKNYSFQDVADQFRVIDDNSVTVVADMDLVSELEKGETVQSNELVRGSVNVRQYVVKELRLNVIRGYPELFKFSEAQYDSKFLGYMKAIMDINPKFKCHFY